MAREGGNPTTLRVVAGPWVGVRTTRVYLR